MVKKNKKNANKRKNIKTKEISKKEGERNSQLYFIFIVMISLIILIIGLYLHFRPETEFAYKGLTFHKERFGEIVTYRYTYFFEGKNGLTEFNLRLRGDPRRNGVKTSEQDIIFPTGKRVFISVNSTGIISCEDTYPAFITLGSFIANNEIDYRRATPDSEEAVEQGIPFVNCSNQPANPVILIQQSEKSEIVVDGLCYTINVANCRITPAIETFIVELLVDSKLGTVKDNKIIIK